MHRIHVVGVSARSGTTLMAECMRICFDIDGYEKHESPLWKMRRGISIYLTKSPQDIMYMGPRFALDPRLTIICMMRDPRDVVVSKHRKGPGQYFTSLGRWKYRNNFIGKHIHHDRFILVKYEDFIKNPDAIQNYLMSRIKYLKKTRSFSEFHENSGISEKSAEALGGIRPFNQNNTSNWKKHLPRLVDQINKYGKITDDLIHYGYEKDGRWADELISVEPLKNHPRDKRVTKNLVKFFWTYPMGAVAAYICYLFSLSYV